LKAIAQAADVSRTGLSSAADLGAFWDPSWDEIAVELNLSEPLGMRVDVRCVVIKVEIPGQAVSLGVCLDSVVTHMGNTPVRSLSDIQAFIGEARMGKHSMHQTIRMRLPPPGYTHPPAPLSAMPSAPSANSASTVAIAENTAGAAVASDNTTMGLGASSVSENRMVAVAATDNTENPLTTLMESLGGGSSGRGQSGQKPAGRRFARPRGKPLPTISFIDRNMVPRMPWHDVGLSVGGCAARDVALHFISRWNHHRLVLGELKEPSLLPHSDHVQIANHVPPGLMATMTSGRNLGG